MGDLLEISDLVVEALEQYGPVRLVDGVCLTVAPGEIVGLVGESGCGKSMTASAIMRLFSSSAIRIAAGQVSLRGAGRLDTMSGRLLRTVRGARIGMVFQDPSTYLNPLTTVGRQVSEGLRAHKVPGNHSETVVKLLDRMGIADPVQLMRRYPHELSGGQRQRVLIAAALALNPDLLIADEPTTALDVTVQAEILALLRELRDRMGLSILFITHDLGVVAEMCERVYVMYAGRIAETRRVDALFTDSRHPYTAGLLRGTLSPSARPEDLYSIPGSVPDPRCMPEGCRFHPRCPIAQDRCRVERPPLSPVADGAAACWFAGGTS
jgi:oligopeptide/dipeptide ABC transporter ATP-binding protein